MAMVDGQGVPAHVQENFTEHLIHLLHSVYTTENVHSRIQKIIDGDHYSDLVYRIDAGRDGSKDFVGGYRHAREFTAAYPTLKGVRVRIRGLYVALPTGEKVILEVALEKDYRFSPNERIMIVRKIDIIVDKVQSSNMVKQILDDIFSTPIA